MTRLKKPLLIGVVCALGLAVNLVQAQHRPLKVFVLVGQSNMQGHAHVRTLPHIGMDPETKPMLDEILDDQGQPRVVEDVWISYLSSDGVKKGQLTTGFGADQNKIGPELTFGIYMQKRLGEPILLIKTAWGGKSINTDFRSPGAGPYEFGEDVLNRLRDQGKDIEAVQAEKRQATGVYYRSSVEHFKNVLADIKTVYPGYDPKQGYELAGLVWFQGWNDMVDNGTYPRRNEPGGYQAYSDVLGHWIRDMRKDLSSPDLPVVIGVLGVGGPVADYSPDQKRYRETHQNFRDAMAAPAGLDEFKGNVVAVLTENYWDPELDAIVARDEQIRNRVNNFKKEGKLDDLVKEIRADGELGQEELQVFRQLQNEGKLEQALLARLGATTFNAREMQVLELGKSNAAYHYLGSAKILAGIGKAFAEAMPVANRAGK